MNSTFEVMQACLLCDFGEILSRAGTGQGQPEQRAADYFSDKLSTNVAEAIQYSRTATEQEDKLDPDSLAYIVCAARKIARGHDEPSALTAVPSRDQAALESIFNHLNQGAGKARYKADWREDGIQYPSMSACNDVTAYRHVLEQWEKALDSRMFEPTHANALLELLGRCFSYVPASEQGSGRCDVPFLQQGKATAAIGCCLDRWLNHRGVTNYREALAPDSEFFNAEQPFVLFSMDLSGIQSFIYTISSKGALKGLRVRSFYLAMLMEHIADTILEACQLYRVNLIYSGGGRAHLLLPNDGICIQRAEEVVRVANDFLRERYGASLFLATGYAKASAAQLSSEDGASQGFSGLFHEASRGISRQKLQRYSASELLALNRRENHRPSDRECVICGRSGRLVPHGDNDMVCETCNRLVHFSNTLTENNLLLKVGREDSASAIPLPGGLWLSQADSASEADRAVRAYCVNGSVSPIPRCIWLQIGNFRSTSIDGTALTFEELAKASVGIPRLGVFRADVDNLGMLFASGLTAPEEANPHRFETLPRYMALSSAMTTFFQKEINRIVGQIGATWLPSGQLPERRHVSIVYSGGDDVFLVGAWNEVLDVGLALRDAFHRYTGGGVTLSAGLGLFTPHEPVGIMADITADLEESAKLIEDGSKNAVALFSPSTARNGSSFDFHWDTLTDNILGEKVPMLYRIFKEVFTEREDVGNAFLYQVLSLLRDILSDLLQEKEGASIAIARLAYLLARHAPEKKRNMNDQEKLRADHYEAFNRQVYRWAFEPEENRALQAAILLHVYSNRKERDSDV